MKKGFTLVEMMIVVSILGIIAAIAFPEFQNHTQKAREAAAKDTLRVYRNAIERYAADNNGVPPGFPNNDKANTPFLLPFIGDFIQPKKYLKELPENPFNDSNVISLVTDEPTEADGTTGWIYNPYTKDVRLNYIGVDSEGISFFDY